MVFLAGALLTTQLHVTGLPYIFILLACATIVWIKVFWVKCPRCSGPIGMSNASISDRPIMQSAKRMNYCPYCGVSFDDSLEV